MRAGMIVAILLGALPRSVTAAEPKVLQSSPANRAEDVDASVRELRVTFDQAMEQGGFSFVGGGPEFPKVTDKPHWVDDRTCVLPVELEPDQDYALSINSQTFQNFRGQNGEPATPYPILFSTAPAKDGPKLTKEENRNAIAALRKAIDENYAHRDLKKLDWDKLFAANDSAMQNAQTPRQFAHAAAKLLARRRTCMSGCALASKPSARRSMCIRRIGISTRCLRKRRRSNRAIVSGQDKSRACLTS